MKLEFVPPPLNPEEDDAFLNMLQGPDAPHNLELHK